MEKQLQIDEERKKEAAEPCTPSLTTPSLDPRAAMLSAIKSRQVVSSSPESESKPGDPREVIGAEQKL